MITSFLYSLAAGTLLVLATGDAKRIAWKFLRTIGVILLAITAGMTLWLWNAGKNEGAPTDTIVLTCGAVATLTAIMLILFAPWAAQKRALYRALGILGGLAAWWAATRTAADLPGSVAGEKTLDFLILAADRLLAGLLLGGVTVAWLLGHAYLTATKMTIATLRHFSRMLNLTVLLRWLFLPIGLLAAYLTYEQALPTAPSFWTVLTGAWLVLALRIGLGLIAVGIFAWMVTDCVRLRATQSATGILYFGSIFVYVGELAALYMIHEWGWPL